MRRIFSDYLAGRTPRQIAAALNCEGVPGPRGGKWNASTINGSRERQNGILQNRLYAGENVWNRQRFLKDPASGKRVSRLNPENEWMVSRVEHLRIVDDASFAEARAIKQEKGRQHPIHARKPRHLLSGLVKCGVCGSGYTVMGNDRLGCAGFRERGDCANNRTVTRLHIEERVLVALQAQLAEPERVVASMSALTTPSANGRWRNRETVSMPNPGVAEKYRRIAANLHQHLRALEQDSKRDALFAELR